MITGVDGPTGTSALLIFPTHQGRDRSLEWGAEFFDGPSEDFAGGLDGEVLSGGDFAEALVRDGFRFQEILGFGSVFRRDRDDDAGLAFVEEGDVGAGAGDFGFGSEVSA